jgi:myo-inositol-1(or 4)-monophosphatase
VLRQGGVTLEELARVALDVAREAGAQALGSWRSHIAIREKGRRDLVTEADLASERLIRERLAALTPDIPMVGEEEGGERDAPRVWYCDPIDGTTNYAHGHPVWAVSIGLMEGALPLLGAVVAPALSTEWHAWQGGTAHRNGQPCAVSDTDDIQNALVATGFPRERDTAPDNNFDSFVRVKKACRGVRRCGAASVDLCWVADGTFDGYWERRLSTWDLAAGTAIVLAAGGRVSHLDGSAPRLAEGNLIASNGRVHDQLATFVRD